MKRGIIFSFCKNIFFLWLSPGIVPNFPSSRIIVVDSTKFWQKGICIIIQLVINDSWTILGEKQTK